MLLDKQKQLPYNTVMKLTTGEEIITKVVEETTEDYVIEKPLQMVMGAQGPQFAPFMMMADPDKKIPLAKRCVIVSAAANPKLEEQYESLTSSIALPKKPSIITA